MSIRKSAMLLVLLPALLLAGCKPVTREGASAAVPAAAPAAGEPVVLRFDTEPFSTYQEGAVVRGERARYSIELQENEYLQVYVGSAATSSEFGNVAMQIWGPDGQTLPGAGEGDDATGWAGVVPQAGEYLIEVGSIRGNAEYSMSARVSPVGYAPIDAEVCAVIKSDVETALGLTLEQSQAPFYDGPNDLGGEGCRLYFEGAGLQFTDSQQVFDTIAAALPGWEEDAAYQASGSTGVATALVRDQALLLVSILWQPTEDADCPVDEPISSCELTPEQRYFVISLDAAQK
mgnify:CR=1 FL=1